jgi:hypothetical protein
MSDPIDKIKDAVNEPASASDAPLTADALSPPGGELHMISVELSHIRIILDEISLRQGAAEALAAASFLLTGAVAVLLTITLLHLRRPK